MRLAKHFIAFYNKFIIRSTNVMILLISQDDKKISKSHFCLENVKILPYFMQGYNETSLRNITKSVYH